MNYVTSYSGVWIEMQHLSLPQTFHDVTSYSDVWVEIVGEHRRNAYANGSHPTRMCGLKYLKISQVHTSNPCHILHTYPHPTGKDPAKKQQKEERLHSSNVPF